MNLIPEPDLCLINYQGFFKKMKLLLFLISGTKKKQSPQNTQRGKCPFCCFLRKPFDMEIIGVNSCSLKTLRSNSDNACLDLPSTETEDHRASCSTLDSSFPSSLWQQLNICACNHKDCICTRPDKSVLLILPGRTSMQVPSQTMY